jgi:glutathione S-transferase
MLILYLGDHHFSSWSMRARLALMESGVEYTERVVELDWPTRTAGDVLVVGDGDEGRKPHSACACTPSALATADKEALLAESFVGLVPQVPVLVDDQSGAVVYGPDMSKQA